MTTKKGKQPLSVTHPELAKRLVNLNLANSITRGSEKKVEWICDLGHNFIKSPSEIKETSGCPYCHGTKVLPGFNDLSSQFPEIAREILELDPAQVSKSSHKICNWQCKDGHTRKARINSRTSNNASCPYCSGIKILKGLNDLKTLHPDIAAEAVGWDPSTFGRGSKTKVEWKCPSGHTYSASISDRSGKGSGCPSCAEFGFNPSKDGFLYFLHHANWNMYQIGITNFPNDRLGTHKKLGWEVLELRGPMDGQLTQQWETAILRMLKAKGADLSSAEIAGKFDGYSEAWSKSTFEVNSIKELMLLTEEFEEK